MKIGCTQISPHIFHYSDVIVVQLKSDQLTELINNNDIMPTIMILCQLTVRTLHLVKNDDKPLFITS